METFAWPSREQVIRIHDASIARFGGSFGLRDEGLLDSALARPFASFCGVNMFSDDIARLCAMVFSIIGNHPFVDGNKRTGTALLGLVLRSSGMKFKPRHDELYEIMIGVADGSVDLDSLTRWAKLQVE